MEPPDNFVRFVNKKVYSTRTATLLARDDSLDDEIFEEKVRSRFLYRIGEGSYFLVTLTKWPGEHDTLIPISQVKAIGYFEGPLTEHLVSYQEAFPGMKFEGHTHKTI